jgi:hypothetical protein
LHRTSTSCVCTSIQGNITSSSLAQYPRFPATLRFQNLFGTTRIFKT